MPSLNQMKAVVVRAGLCLHFVLVVWRVTVSWTDTYWLLAAGILPFLVEGLYTVTKRNGIEWKLFSLCFFFYLAATLPGIWLLEIRRTMTYQSQNYTQVESLSVSGVDIPLRLSPNTWVLVVEEMMLYFMILGRWMLPRGDVGREQLTQLLFGFIGIASDIMELFSLFDEDSQIRHSAFLTYIILGIWSLSVLQFTLTFATAHRPRRARGLRMTPEEEEEEDDRKSRQRRSREKRRSPADVQEAERRHRLSVMRVELLATVLSMFMQDGPFLAVRLYAMLTYHVVTYSLVFFTAKNVLVLLLLVYKIFLLLGKICCPKSLPDEEGDPRSIGQKDSDYGVDDYDVDYDGMGMKKIPPKKQTNGRVLDAESGDLRRRKEGKGVFLEGGEAGDQKKRKEDKGRIGQDPGYDGVPDPQFGDLQKVIDGPATPAKSMERTKKYDKYMVDNETAQDAGKGDGAKEDSAELSHDGDQDGKGDAPGSRITARDSGLPDHPGDLRFSDREPKEATSDLDRISDDSGHPEPTATDFRPHSDHRGQDPPARAARIEHGSSPSTNTSAPQPRQAANARDKGRVAVAADKGNSAGEQGAKDAGSDRNKLGRFVSLVKIKM